jgi:hypothetical protein
VGIVTYKFDHTILSDYLADNFSDRIIQIRGDTFLIIEPVQLIPLLLKMLEMAQKGQTVED